MRERINAKIRNACTLHKTQGAWNISSLFGMDGDGNHEDVPVLGDPPRPVDDHDVQHEATSPITSSTNPAIALTSVSAIMFPNF